MLQEEHLGGAGLVGKTGLRVLTLLAASACLIGRGT
jgi:hypothetical protein